jgi:predicted CxxxxCH...CXXCH cytochrome family protein
MGFRISFVRVPKGFKLRNSFKDENDYESYQNVYGKVAEYVKFDTCTNIFCHSSNENNRLFTQIDENEDTVVGTVSKEQLY